MSSCDGWLPAPDYYLGINPSMVHSCQMLLTSSKAARNSFTEVRLKKSTEVLRGVGFDPDHPYELPVKSLLALKRRGSSTKKGSNPQVSASSRRASPTPQYSPLDPVTRLGSPSSSPRKMVSTIQDQPVREMGRPIKSWELISPSEGWKCEGDDVENKGVE
ncbi:hypothetical protein PIB30_050416 [Stylosanthes scabra]|uniref:Uncharacterized protein n=1 Tax=Stylosanthes scabra TaxID=79078 RepID=A0ABU6XIT9_9FABA|nr:hypothetical protein [Stylosanthes scabra]